jgi:hypothetical protein
MVLGDYFLIIFLRVKERGVCGMIIDGRALSFRAADGIICLWLPKRDNVRDIKGVIYLWDYP